MDSSRRGQGKSVKTRVVYVDRPERTERKPERRTERRKSIHATRPSEQKPTKPRKWLGDGGFADVYSETDPTTRQKFAVKVFKSKREIATATDLSENELKSRIRREIQILQSLSNVSLLYLQCSQLEEAQDDCVRRAHISYATSLITRSMEGLNCT